MDYYFDIAYALADKRLCIFTGTGFSKSITANGAPGWKELLIECCASLSKEQEIIKELFPEDGKNPLSLEEAAQVIDLELKSTGTSIHSKIKDIISELKFDDSNTTIKDFFDTHSLRILTTNYDNLIEQITGKENSLTIAPGTPIPITRAHTKTYHLHGSVKAEEKMIVTANDYFRFLNQPSYFSKKMSTILHENVIVILGYSLGDTNLKLILNEFKFNHEKNGSVNNVYFVSRSKVSRRLKSYYSYCYGIKVIDETEISTFFTLIQNKYDEAAQTLENAKEALEDVLENDRIYEEKYIKQRNSFFEILHTMRAKGKDLSHSRVCEILGKIFETKISLTKESGAWEQYEHLASWLIFLGSRYNINNTALQEKYLQAVDRSYQKMSQELYLGFSWQAFKIWNKSWLDMLFENRQLIKERFSTTQDSDTLKIINKG